MAHTGNGGLQDHSIGDSYPWTVIGTVDGEGDTIYYVANLITNERESITYESSFVAHYVAKTISDGKYDPIALVRWIK